jgi:2-keto-4-pentenoate hydratase
MHQPAAPSVSRKLGWNPQPQRERQKGWLMPIADPHAAASILYEARRTGVPVEPFTDSDPSLGMDDGYAVQEHLVRMLLEDGERIAGYKVGLTSKPMQQMVGVSSPDYGPVLASTVYASGAELPLTRFIQPRLEAEIVFVLGERLAGPGVSVADASRATAGVAASMEIIDSRIVGWRIKLADTVADLASNGAVAISSRIVPLAGLDTRLIGMVLTRNGELVDTGAGAAALGDPLAVVAWLANTLGEHGIALEPGHLVMTGSMHAAVPMAAGDVFRADFDRLGPVTVRVTEK